MNKDNLEGNVRSAVGQGEKVEDGRRMTRRRQPKVFTTTPLARRGRRSEAQRMQSAGVSTRFLPSISLAFATKSAN